MPDLAERNSPHDAVEHLDGPRRVAFGEQLVGQLGVQASGERRPEVRLNRMVGVNSRIVDIAVPELVHQLVVQILAVDAADLQVVAGLFSRRAGRPDRHETVCEAVELQIILQTERRGEENCVK